MHGQHPESEQPGLVTIATLVGVPRGSVVGSLPTRETWVPSPGLEDPLEREMAAHSSFLTWRITEEPGGLQSVGSQRVGRC